VICRIEKELKSYMKSDERERGMIHEGNPKKTYPETQYHYPGLFLSFNNGRVFIGRDTNNMVRAKSGTVVLVRAGDEFSV
jgi:hypothetical protein